MDRTPGGAAPSWLVVGLGNPGPSYEKTRHNVGFCLLDHLAQKEQTSIQRLRWQALTQQVSVGNCSILLMKPITYMNLSGLAVSAGAQACGLAPHQVLVISDDTNLPFGRLRLRKGGSAGGHNGLKSIIQELGTDQFPRLRVGVGQKPHPEYEMARWVLGSFSQEEWAAIPSILDRGADAILDILSQGMDRAMSRWNGS